MADQVTYMRVRDMKIFRKQFFKRNQNFLPKSKFFTIFCNKSHIKINHMGMLLLVLDRYYYVINIRDFIFSWKPEIQPESPDSSLILAKIEIN